MFNAGKEHSPVDSEYKRMEKAIRYIEDHADEQPGLAEVSEYVGLSPYHFQRLFKRWTGVSPKRYLQFLTVENAKHLLARSTSVLETTYGVGLSSPGRLHDLFVSVEAVTPGQYKSRGAGVELKYGFHQTPFGNALLAMTENGITDLWFVDEEDEGEALIELQRVWPAADITQGAEATWKIVSRIFGGVSRQAQEDRVDLLLRGTNFQVKVWQALLRIPEGVVVSYSDVAKRVGRHDAVRAVAGAVAANPIAWLIPCHRVLRSSGEIGGYRWGTTRKKMMLAREIAGQAGK
jgi:AraC family transcriptional regulator of adaptative response/methylated-DNA-[protein]-cysteine methyltransferase